MVDGVDARYRVQGLDPGTRVVENSGISKGFLDVTCVYCMCFLAYCEC